MNRRDIIKGTLALGGVGLCVPIVRAADYPGKLLVSVQAGGGWDPTSFCDPKANVPDERVINHWAEEDDIREAGGIAFAPFANNVAFFGKYHRRMLVINGVDAQTNSHGTGARYNWSGRNTNGYPSLTALLAAHHGAGLEMPYLTFGGYSATHGVTNAMRFGNGSRLHDLFGPSYVYQPSERQMVQQYAAARSKAIGARAGTPGLMPRAARSLANFESAFNGEGFMGFADALPEDLEGGLRTQTQLAIAAFESGVAVSADLFIGGFDTHGDHDEEHAQALAQLTDGVDFLWEHAEARGVADRLVVVIGSDFGRTNFYNENDGKDHWPIGSYVVMEKNQHWTDRAVGETDGLHFAHRIDPATLRRDDANGAIIHPRHVHKALRRHLGIEQSPATQRFRINHTEDFAFFG